ncbi:bromodomain adjacent to zinc finger domain protein 1A isoform X3 [Macaca thibetana thibetana]|uniref:Bromodomain adjacent to zinc finger domain protein 1A n=3 Tax=Cercopithecinae TaxID=9528 RepID=I2CWD3_MACMU|nr:bromodomain adjacent to zinc finger domain protein 1A isoform X3 [Macaca fascicularis]XP_028707325.1 bromodomain adjacent to zinc finger domain protein 1A isoform X2 [Macaca mulatta]XP_031525009.1 bromodomain adjacent to zinc finger domain protein 1A isoform X2 [Papio anubis]XP_050654056.1 bromodomain adjacent to zinc finger domain protein 1A isoform X3 [Macaca thibetana thibetana]
MPLLHRKPFVRQKPPADLRPDEEVFYCKVTNEIFRHYDDFFERTILCNSLVWSCAVTGRPGLTYQEALESEKKARQNLQSFPEPLIIPVLYLTSLTHRSRLHEICDDIFAYVKDRYFVEETVEVIRNNGARLQCRILEVLPPSHQNGFANGHVNSVDGETIIISDSDDSETQSCSFQNGKKKDAIDPLLFKYKVQPTKKELYESAIVKATQISRRKHLFSRDKLKLFLKQHCEPQDGIIKIKASSLSTYKIAEQDFSYFFPDDPPTFIFSPANRRRGRPPKRIPISQEDNVANKQTLASYRNKATKERDKLLKQEEMKSLAFEKAKLKREKADALEAKKKEKEDKEKKREELKKIVEEERLKKKEEKERLKVEREKEREKLREEKRKYVEYLKQWSKPREDMECDDLKELPEPTPVKTRLPPEIFGDALMVLEFLNAFGELFDLQDEFPDGVTLEVLEEALVGNDSEGPLCELLFFFLTAIFQAIAEEEEEVAKEQLTDADTKDLTEALDEDADPTKSALSAVASLAAAWPQLHQGCSLKSLDLDSCTLSEILRLHILASGADVTSANAKYRYQKRGGFDATDDACMELRLSNPSLVKKLSSTSVYDLTPGEKMKILHALCGKLLTLVSTRDFIEDYVDILRQAKQEFRELKAEQHRKEREEAAARIRKRKEEKLKEQEQKLKEKQEKLKEDEQRNSTADTSIGEEEREDFDTSTESKDTEQKELDQDMVTEDEDDPGSHKRGRRGKRGQNGFKEFTRQEEINCVTREPLTAEEDEALKQEHQRKEKELLEKIQSAIACTNIFPLGRDRMYRRYWIFPSIPGLFIEEDYSGLTEDMLLPRPSSFQNNVQSQDPQVSTKTGEPLMSESTSNIEQGPRDHSVQLPKPVHKPNRWCFYSSCEQLDQLIEALNSRGHRESALKETLLQEKSRICAQLARFSEEKFHFSDKPQPDSKPTYSRGRSSNAYDPSQMCAEKQLELRLRDFLLDIEDRIYQGTLGAIKVTDRYIWRSALESGRYELLSEENKENGIIKTVNEDVEEMEIDEQTKVIVKDRLLGIKTETPSTVSTNASTPQSVSSVVHYLAMALFQIEQGIERRFLKAPLDASDSGRSYKTILDRWRESLLSSASLSQVFLHLSTLDRSVIWSKSILNARCKICRKKGDAENMVLCDGCDRGHHTYCVRPKLKTVPEGDWFCPECRPKQRPRRLSSRQRPSLESDEDVEDSMGGEDDEVDGDEEEGQSEEEEYEVEQDEDDSQEEEEVSLPKRGRPQVRLPVKTRGKLSSSFSSRGQRQEPGRYPSRSQQSTPKTTVSSKTGRSLRKISSAPPTETKSLRIASRSTRHSHGPLQADVFVELLSPRRKRRGRKSANNTPENSPNFPNFRVIATKSSEQSRSLNVASKLSLQESESTRRCRKRQSPESSPVTLGRRSSGRQGGVHELSAFEQLVVELVRHDDSWPFLKLVSKIQVPDYYDIIKKPIALNIIREKVNKCEYKIASEFIDDIELMFSNCFEYNPRNTSEAKAGTRLQAFFHIQAQKLGLHITPSNVDQVSTPPAAKKSRI